MIKFLRFAVSAVLVTTALACEKAEAPTPAGAEQIIAPNTPQRQVTEPALEASALRKAYGLAEMKFNDCTKLNAEGALVGEDCTTGCILFGPYAAVPKNSDLRMAFDIESQGPLVVASDIVSDTGSKNYGTLEGQGIQPKSTRHIEYKVHFDETNAGIEARLWITADSPTDFKITNYNLEVL
jgi:hypothetical protein